MLFHDFGHLIQEKVEDASAIITLFHDFGYSVQKTYEDVSARIALFL